MSNSIFLATLPIWIGLICAIIPAIIKGFKDKDSFTAYTSKRQNMRGKIPSQTNRLSQYVLKEQQEMQELEEEHATSYCKYTYTTQDPNFSFNGLPNDFDDFAELRKKNAAHERHLQRKIY